MEHKEPFIIGEVSGNHNKDLKRAIAHIEVAAKCGCSAVKFQTFEAKDIAANNVKIPRGINDLHDRWLDNIGATYLHELLSQGGLPREFHKALFNVALDHDIEFISTPFSVDAAKFLVEEIGVKTVKVASGDLTFTPLLEYLDTVPHIDVILSTGMAFIDEIYVALESMPNRNFINTSLLHCVSCYPCPPSDANIGAINVMRSVFYNPIGYSDHTTDTIHVPMMAIGAGATILEKHFTIDQEFTIDSPHSLVPHELENYVNHANLAYKIVGDRLKTPRHSEMHDRIWARRDHVDWLRPTIPGRHGVWS